MNIVVVGGGSWGTTFARLLFDHGHEVTLACRDPEQAAAIRETRRNPRYMADVDLTGIAAAAIPSSAPAPSVGVQSSMVMGGAFGSSNAARTVPGCGDVCARGLTLVGDRPSGRSAQRRSTRSRARWTSPSTVPEFSRTMPSSSSACRS